MDEHNECFPHFGKPAEGGANPITFGGKKSLGLGPYYEDEYGAEYRVLNRYLDIYDEPDPSLEVFHCPDDITRVNGHAEMEARYNNFDWNGNSYTISGRILYFGSAGDPKPRPLSTVTVSRNKLCLEVCSTGNKPGHGRGKYASNRTPVMVLFVDGPVAGPFLYNEDFEVNPPEPDKKVLMDPNGTTDIYD